MHIGNKIWEGNILIPYMLLYPAQRLSLFLCDKFHQVGAKAKAVEEEAKGVEEEDNGKFKQVFNNFAWTMY